jgi:aminopeptidase N
LSDSKYKIRVAYVVAHELAHQWFGNLVTMEWWNSLWYQPSSKVSNARLNEGFATWVGWLAIDRLYPEWDIWSKFTSEALQAALTMDSMKSSHAIEVEVNNALEIDQIFDAISYYKGSSCINMLSKFLGVETFLKVYWLVVRF